MKSARTIVQPSRHNHSDPKRSGTFRHLKKRYQLFRYFLSAMGSLVLNYFNLKIMVDVLGFYPTIAQVINVVIVVTFSYLMQRYFAFKGAKQQ